jgi:hypothetical protein
MRLLLSLLLLAACGPAVAADLSKIDRSIAREPKYVGKPSYCLLVFGAEAKHRVWIVQDGDALYVDRNGNGDLTEPGERFLPSRRNVGHFEDVALKDPKGAGTYSCSVRPVTGGRHQVHVAVKGAYQQYAVAKFAGRRDEAPILHFAGPLTVAPAIGQLRLADGTAELRVVVGTRGWARGAAPWAVINHDFGTPGDKVHPVAEVEYPGAGGRGAETRVTATLKQRC